jgi:SAM-dependent methyltransferase
MQSKAFDILKSIEDTWWHYGRTEAVSSALKSAGVHTPCTCILDVGAGYGGMYEFLHRYGVVQGTEPEADAKQVCIERGYEKFFANPKEVLATSLRYDLIGAFDVIEHVEDDGSFVKELYDVTLPSGHIVATVPAFQFLWSTHDVTHMHFRRHTAGSMRKLLTAAGYEVVYVRYWNTTLFPIAVLMRLMGRSGEAGLHTSDIVTKVLKCMLWVEARVLRFVPIPFGLSVVIVGVKH